MLNIILLSANQKVARSVAKAVNVLSQDLPLSLVMMLIFHGGWDNIYAMRHFEGAFFVIFGLLKLINWKGFVDASRTYDIVAKRSRFYAYIYHLIELGLGIAYLTSFQLFITNIITLVIMVIGTLGVADALIHKRQIICACMGAVFKVPMTTVTLIEDLLMWIMALLMVILMVS